MFWQLNLSSTLYQETYLLTLTRITFSFDYFSQLFHHRTTGIMSLDDCCWIEKIKAQLGSFTFNLIPRCSPHGRHRPRLSPPRWLWLTWAGGKQTPDAPRILRRPCRCSWQPDERRSFQLPGRKNTARALSIENLISLLLEDVVKKFMIHSVWVKLYLESK